MKVKEAATASSLMLKVVFHAGPFRASNFVCIVSPQVVAALCLQARRERMAQPRA